MSPCGRVGAKGRGTSSCATPQCQSNLEVEADLGEPLVRNLEKIGGTARDTREEGEDRERDRRHGRVLGTADHDFMGDVIMHVTEIDLQAERVAIPECC